MPQTRPNKTVVPVNSDAYNLTSDLATFGDSANVVIRVASQAERDALTKAAGLTVARADLPGNPIQTCDGTNWATQQAPKVWATAPRVGSASNLLTNLQSGAYVPIIQAGTVVVSTDANGYSNFAFPQAFPNGLICWVGMNADDVATGTNVFITQGSAGVSATTAYFNAWKATGAAYASQTIRLDYIAIGW